MLKVVMATPPQTFIEWRLCSSLLCSTKACWMKVFNCVVFFLTLFFLVPASSNLGQLLVNSLYLNIFFWRRGSFILGQRGGTGGERQTRCWLNTCYLLPWLIWRAVPTPADHLSLGKYRGKVFTLVSFCPAPSQMVSMSRLWLNLKNSVSRFMQHLITEPEVILPNIDSILFWKKKMLRKEYFGKQHETDPGIMYF